VKAFLRRSVWVAGWPGRTLLIGSIRGYRLLLGPVLGGGCRFYPSCSVYAERAIAEWGAIRGMGLAVWRVLRCSPLTRGGVDHPPVRRRAVEYDDDIQRGRVAAVARGAREAVA
jgi:putative membrane protein insertion efficiency factor